MGLKIQKRVTTKARVITTLIAVFALIAQPAYGFVAGQTANAISGTGVDLQSAINAAPIGGTVDLTGDVIVADTQVTINKSLVLNGHGFTITPAYTSSQSGNNDNVLLITGNNVVVNNLIVDGANKAGLQGIQVWGATAKATLNDVTVKNNKKAGLHANKNSKVVVNNITTSNNGTSYGGVMVSGGSVLDIYRTSTHTSESLQIYNDLFDQGVVHDHDNQYDVTYGVLYTLRTLTPSITATNFNTNSGSDYKGLNVGFTLNDDFRNVSAVKVELFQGSTLLATNTDNTALLALINNGEKSLSTPFIMTPGNYVEGFWNLGQHDWLRTEVPTKAVITVTDDKGAHMAENTNFVEPNGWTFTSLFNNYVQQSADSKFVATPLSVRENNAGDLAAYVTVPKVATDVAFTFTGKNGAPSFVDVAGYEHFQTNQWPNSAGAHQYRVGVSAPAGEYDVTAKYKTNDGTGNWYQVSGVATTYSVKTPIANYVTPEADGSTVIRTNDNPSQVRISDAGKHFTYVNFVIDNITYKVPRDKCDLRQAGNYVICQVKNAVVVKDNSGNIINPAWPVTGLTDGLHTINRVVAYDSANGNVTLPARMFTVDSEAPVIVSSKITTPIASIYTKTATVTTTATDNINLQSVTVFAVKKVNGTCDVNGVKVMTQTVPATTRNATVDTIFGTSGLNGEYCFYATAKDQATHSSNPNVTNAKFVASFDNVVPEAPGKLEIRTKATSGFIPSGSPTNVEHNTLSWENSTSTDDVDHYVYKFWTDFDDLKAANPWTTENTNNRHLITPAADDRSVIDVNFYGEGTYFFCVTAVDKAGNESDCSATYSVDYDITDPTASISTSPSIASGDTVKSPLVLNGTSNENVKHWIEVKAPNGTLYYWQTPSNVFSQSADLDVLNAKDAHDVLIPTLNGRLVDGTYTVRYVASDRAGNRSDHLNTPQFASTIFKFTIDNTAPAVTIDKPVSIRSGDVLNLKGTVDADVATIKVTLNGSSITVPEANINRIAGTWSLAVTNTSALSSVVSPYDIVVSAVDSLDNPSSASAASTTRLTVLPVGGNTLNSVTGAPNTPGDGTNQNSPVAPGFTLASPATTLIDPPTVLGTQTAKGSILAASDKVAAIAPSEQGWKIFGTAWYWWALIVAAVAAIMWWIVAAARRRSENV